MSTEQHTNEQKSCNSCTHKCLIALNIVLLIGLAVLYVLFFKSTSCKTDTQEATAIAQPVETTDNPTLTIGYIDTDSLMLQYDFAIELNEKLESYTRQENDYKDMMMRFQNDYNNFLKTGASLTLTEQKKTEETDEEKTEENNVKPNETENISENIETSTSDIETKEKMLAIAH